MVWGDEDENECITCEIEIDYETKNKPPANVVKRTDHICTKRDAIAGSLLSSSLHFFAMASSLLRM